MNRYRVFLLLVLSWTLMALPCHAQVQHSYGTLDQFNPWTAVNQFTVGLFTGPMTYSQITALVFISPGTIITCSNCTTGSNPCTIGSSQVIAVYLNSVWNCGFGGSGGGSNPGIANQVAYYATSGSTVSGDSNLTDNATNLTYIPSGGIVASALSSPSSSAPMILRSPVPISGCTPQAGFSLMTPSTDGNWYDSNNGGTCYRHQLESTTSPAGTNQATYFDSNGLTHPSSDVFVDSPNSGLNLGTAGSTNGTITFRSASVGSTGYVALQATGIYSGGNITVGVPNSGVSNSELVTGFGFSTIGDCLKISNTVGYVITDTGASCGGSGGANPPLEYCIADQTGNSFPAAESLTNGFAAQWGFQFNTTTYIMCQVYIQTAQAGATLVLDIWANDATAGHTATFQTCDVVMSSTLQFGSPSCAAGQTFTTTSTAYAHTQLTFNVQSSLSNNSILVVKIATSPTGTAPTSAMLFYPHFIL